MSQLWTILRREYVERVRQRFFLVSTILGPFLLLGITIGPAWLAERSSPGMQRILVVDETGQLVERLGPAFPDTLQDGARAYLFETISLPAGTAYDDQRAALEGRIWDGEFSALLRIPPDALEGGTAVLFARTLGDIEQISRIREGLSRAATAARLEAHRIPADEVDRIARRIPVKSFKLTEEGAKEGGFETDFIAGAVLALMLYITLIMYGVGISRSVLEDKSSRIIEVLLASIRPLPLLLGKILGVGAVGLTQFGIWSAVALAGLAYLKATSPALALVSLPPVVFLYFILYFILGFFLYASMYAAVGAAVTSDQEAQQFQWPITFLLVIPMLMLSSILRNPDSTSTAVLSLVPFFSPVLMMLRINIHPPPAWQIALSLVLLGASTLGIAAVAARVFRVGILVYGKRPTLPELLKWIRAR